MSENIVEVTSRNRSGTAKRTNGRQGNLPIWIRAPKRGPEYYTGLTRPKLYEFAAKGYICSVSIREPGQNRGTRLFHLQSILAFIESHCRPPKKAAVTKSAAKQFPLRSKPAPRRGSTPAGDSQYL